MPDLQTEMQKILQAWDEPETIETTEEPTVFTTTTNTSRATFEIVRDNPGLSKAQYISKLEIMGHKKSSTSSLLAQMTRQGHIWVDSSGCLRPNHTEYRPLKSTTTLKNKAKKAKPAKSYKVITSEEVAVPKPKLIELPVRSKIEVILDTITLSEAHELYRKLHQYFGGLSK